MPTDVRPAAAVEAIMDEEPPWSSRGASVPELKDSRSSSDVEREDELASREGEGDAKKEVEEGQEMEGIQEEKVKKPQEPQENQPMTLNRAEPQKKPAGAFSSTHSDKVSFFYYYYFCSTSLLTRISCHTRRGIRS